MTGSRVEVYRTIGDVKLNAYIFEPKDHAKTDRRPVAVFFFGGGWKGGTPGSVSAAVPAPCGARHGGDLGRLPREEPTQRLPTGLRA
jgi:acetyl esterase/lipase